jgi:zinc/manganese transport system substrate-binding protein
MSSPSIDALFRTSRRVFLGALACGSLLVGTAPVTAAVSSGKAKQPLKVVTSFSILGNMVHEVGGERIALTTLVGPNADAHSFEPSPKDVKALAEADVLVFNGLGFEGWLPRLEASSGFKGQRIEASKGANLRHLSAEDVLHAESGHHNNDGHDHSGHDHAPGSVDPHAWQDLKNGMVYVQNIAEGLAQADPAHRGYYRNRAKTYVETMQKLDAEIRSGLAAVPTDRRTVMTSHDSFGYFARAYGIRFISVTGLSNMAEPSAKEVAAIVDRAKKAKIAGVFVENSTNPKLVRQIAREAGAGVGGTLYSDALAPSDQPASTYLGMFSWNAGRLIYLLKK